MDSEVTPPNNVATTPVSKMPDASTPTTKHTGIIFGVLATYPLIIHPPGKPYDNLIIN